MNEGQVDNTYIFDSESPVELSRLINQEQLVTKAMGGPLAGLPPLQERARVLDLACGPGGWALDIAFNYPNAEVNGVDISRGMIEYAKARATSQMIRNASFRVMDITKPLDFADASFDFVNARFLVGVLKREVWPGFLAECTRILRPDGILRMTEGDEPGKSLSPALETLNAIATRALWMSGYGFSPDGRSFSMSPALLKMFKHAGYQDVHLSTSTFDHSDTSDGWADFRRNQEIMLMQIQPLLMSLGLITDDEFKPLFWQAMSEIHTEDFTAIGQVFSVWSIKAS